MGKLDAFEMTSVEEGQMKAKQKQKLMWKNLRLPVCHH